MSRYLPEGRTGFFDIPVEKLFHGKSNGEIFKMICEDEILRSSILSGICYFANSWDGKYRYFKDWDYKESVKFDKLEYETVMKWAVPAIRELKLIQASDEFVKNKAAQGGGKLDDFLELVPEKYKNSTLDLLKGESRRVADLIVSGKSIALSTGNGVDKLGIAWAAARSIMESGMKSVKLVKQIELMSEFSDNSRVSGGTVKYINDNYTVDLHVLIVCEVESLSGSDIQSKNLRYLLKQRYEERLQTVLLLNLTSDEADDEKALEKHLGEGYPMFKDDDWPAEVIVISGGDDGNGQEID